MKQLYSSTLSIFMAESAYISLEDELTASIDLHLRHHGEPTAEDILDVLFENDEEARDHLPIGEDHFRNALLRRIERLIQDRIDELADDRPYNLHRTIRRDLTL